MKPRSTWGSPQIDAAEAAAARDVVDDGDSLGEGAAAAGAGGAGGAATREGLAAGGCDRDGGGRGLVVIGAIGVGVVTGAVGLVGVRVPEPHGHEGPGGVHLGDAALAGARELGDGHLAACPVLADGDDLPRGPSR